jgi:dolichol-phosphate mannosyltransferase
MISIVVPAFNEAQVLPELRRRLAAAAESWGEEYEVVLVDDGSSDSTPATAAAFHRDDPRWKSLRFSRNFGHQSAVSAGVHYALGDAVVVMDADLQDPPEVIGELLARWRASYDVVYAVRAKRKEGLWKRAAYAAFYRLWRWAAKIDVPLDAGDFCLMDRRVVDVLRRMPERNRFMRGLRCWAGFKHIGVPYERDARAAGDSKYTIARLLRLATAGMTAFSSAPLRLASTVGALFASSAALSVAILAVVWFLEIPIFGIAPATALAWCGLVALILGTTGIQLLFLGIHGEYLSHVLEETKGRPPWVIESALGIRPHGERLGWFVDADRTAESSRRVKPRFSVRIHRPARSDDDRTERKSA